ncbi:MAG TPA: pyridoxamine 5'-phosphate oxidase family protein [Solirubrobacteraceae bacterium]|nr:pyridoxamine 5'-phosphate oxidase family protein [Solirubrobacteraceae bacterium]
MRESPAELERLQDLLDASARGAGPYLRRSFAIPELTPGAAALAARLDGWLTVALASATARGEPRVAPVGALFAHGAFHVPTVAESARARQLVQRPAASLTYYEGAELAVIAHGRAAVLGRAHPAFAQLDALQLACGPSSVRDWGATPVYLRLDAQRLFAYVRPSRHA